MAFQISNAGGTRIAVGLSAPTGTAANAKVSSGNHAENYLITSPNDMYYLLTPDGEGNVMIKNVSGGVLAVTNLKITDAVTTAEGNSDTAVTFRANAKLMRYVQSFDTLPTEEPSVEPSAEPSPTAAPSFAQLLQQLFSSFVSSLFGSISRLFGRP